MPIHTYRSKIAKVKKDIAAQKERIEYEKLRKTCDALRKRR